METLFRMFGFQKPWMALMVLMAFGFSWAIVTYEADHVQKFAWLVASGFASAFFSYGVKAFFSGYQRLGVLMGGLAFLLMYISVDNTPSTIFAADALENTAGFVVGGGTGFFAKVDEEVEEKESESVFSKLRRWLVG